MTQMANAGIGRRDRIDHQAKRPRGDAEMIRLREKGRWAPITSPTRQARHASPVQNILRAEGLGRLDRGDRATTTNQFAVTGETDLVRSCTSLRNNLPAAHH